MLGMWMPKGIRPVRPMPQSQQTIPRNTHTASMKLEYAMEKVQELRAQGLTMHAIGKQLGVSRQRIHQIIHSKEMQSKIESVWTNGMPKRCLKIVNSLKLTTKQEVAEAIAIQKITPNMTKNFGIRSYFDLCEWAEVAPPTTLSYPKRCPHCHESIVNP